MCNCNNGLPWHNENCVPVRWEINPDAFLPLEWRHHQIAWWFNKRRPLYNPLAYYVDAALKDMEDYGYFRKPASQTYNQIALFHLAGERRGG